MTIKCRGDCKNLDDEEINNDEDFAVCIVCNCYFDKKSLNCLCCGALLYVTNEAFEKMRALTSKLNNQQWVKVMSEFLDQKLRERKGTGLTVVEKQLLLELLEEAII